MLKTTILILTGIGFTIGLYMPDHQKKANGKMYDKLQKFFSFESYQSLGHSHSSGSGAGAGSGLKGENGTYHDGAAAVAVAAVAVGSKSVDFVDFDSWLATEEEFSFNSILNNIGGVSDSFGAGEVSKGAVIASPSKYKPNYFFQWVRDAALTVRTLIYYLMENDDRTEQIRSVIESYIENSYHLQRLDNNLGKFDDPEKSGLGEPKFLPNSKAFNENWGRPQSDGPALRISTILLYFDLLYEKKWKLQNEFLKDEAFVYESIIKPDLIYLTYAWPKKTFDLWEEINSVHFFTSISHLRAIKDGLKLARKFENSSEFVNTLFETQTKLIQFIEVTAGFRIPSVPYILETPSLVKEGKRGGLDAAVLLGSLHSHNLDSSDYYDVPFDINDDHILNHLSSMVSDMKFRYPINKEKIGKDPKLGVALGRYPEDIYDGVATSEGNPWFISTATAAEIIYKLIYKLHLNKEDIVIKRENSDFYKNFVDFEIDNLKEVTIPYGSATFEQILRNLFGYSDSFIEIIKEHCGRDGHISEQFNRYTGYMKGASDLTWSYSAFWNSIRWRKRTLKVLEIQD